ncbi:SUMF1/EgtB/PvdO family nonheme iron enzyme, partial [Planctomycetota bacterium]
MDCSELAQLLAERSMGELSAEQSAAVGEHLAACDSCRGRWRLNDESQVLHDAAQPLRARPGAEHTLLDRLNAEELGSEPVEGMRLAGFELLGPLGKGGMGTVFKARQLSMDRLVALKILPRKLAENQDFVVRFIREARSAAKLRHPHIVQAYDVGHAEGVYYFAMEYVDGEGLNAILQREGPLDPQRALRLMRQVCSALVAAHKAGIIHRDIKPSNLMVDQNGDVRVTDFGLAKRAEGDFELTADGQTLGSPTYVSPEMASGKGVDARADLYSLGATFYHLLAGRPPFEGASFSELIVKHVNESPRALFLAAPNVDPRFCRIIDCLLRKDPDARYPSAQALLEELEAFRGLKTAADAATAQPRAVSHEASTPTLGGDQVRRRGAALAAGPDQLRWDFSRVPFAAIGVVVLLLAALGVVFWAGSWLRGRRGRRLPLAPKEQVTPGPEMLERYAESLYGNARRAADDGRWSDAKRYMSTLDSKYAKTRFYAGNRAGIAALRGRVEQKLTEIAAGSKTGVATPVAVKWPVYTKWPFDAREAKRRQKATAEALGVPSERDIDLGNGARMTFVLIPAGEFLMGSPEHPSPGLLAERYGGNAAWYLHERPQHQVRITRPFWLGKYEVTQKQWQAVMDTNPSKFRGPQHPVEQVTWWDCERFLTLLNEKAPRRTFRLPTEAEWEFACRCGTTTQFWFGDAKDRAGDYAWLRENSGGMSHPVGEKKPSPWGLHDMTGNVWEQCQDPYGKYSAERQVDPAGATQANFPVFRGGAWTFDAHLVPLASRMAHPLGR